VLGHGRRHIYADDRQVERIWVQKFEPGRLFRFQAPPAVLAEAIASDKPRLYVRLSHDPTEGLV
jgi:crossover junction endodeoxyribonuclease RusA